MRGEVKPAAKTKGGVRKASSVKPSRSTSNNPPKVHVPLASGLAKIISLELASDEDLVVKSEKLKQAIPKKIDPTPLKIVTSGLSRESSHLPVDGPLLMERKPAPTPAAPATQTVSCNHPQTPYAMSSSLLAARMAEEQEIWAYYLNQRQQQSILQEQFQLEQLRRMQTAMFLYQHPQAGALPCLESLLTGRHTAAQLASETSTVRPLSFAPQALRPDAKDTLGSPAVGGAAAAASNLLSLSPKGPSKIIYHKPIKERPEEYQHLSKKAKRTREKLEVSGETDQSQNHAKKIRTDDESEATDEDANGQRFRAYQYEQWTEKFQELYDFRQERGHW